MSFSELVLCKAAGLLFGFWLFDLLELERLEFALSRCFGKESLFCVVLRP